MSVRSVPFALVLLSAATVAQTGPTYTLSTLSAYGVTADDGVSENVDGVPADTAITAPLELRATADGVTVSSRATLVLGRNGEATIRSRENGSVRNGDPALTRLAATIDEAGPLHSGPHSLRLIVSNVTQNTGTLTISWVGRGFGGATGHVAIDTNDDQVPEFEGDADGHRVTQTLTVTRVTRNFIIDISTECEAEVAGRGAASYFTDLSVTFREGASGCTLTPYGAECAGALAGTQQGQDVTLTLTNAAANGFGVLLLGTQEIDVNIGRCSLLTAPMMVQLFRTDAQGGATHHLRVPSQLPLNLRAQDLIIDRAGIGTSNGLRVDCR